MSINVPFDQARACSDEPPWRKVVAYTCGQRVITLKLECDHKVRRRFRADQGNAPTKARCWECFSK